MEAFHDAEFWAEAPHLLMVPGSGGSAQSKAHTEP